MKSILTLMLILCVPLMGDDAAKKTFEEIKAKAEKGDAKAQGELARELHYGEGNDVEAFEWAEKAAAQNDPQGQFVVGRSYHFGKGVEQDFKEALEW